MKRDIHWNFHRKTVQFTDAEIDEIRKAAIGRQRIKDESAVSLSDKRMSKIDNTEMHFIGLLGEYAFKKVTGLDVDTGEYLAGDLTQDFSIYGVKVEVKTLQGFLAFRRLEDFKSDVAVLVTYKPGNTNQVNVEGWITKSEFAEIHFLDDFGYGPRPCVQPEKLLPIESLQAFCLNAKQIRWVMSRREAA